MTNTEKLKLDLIEEHLRSNNLLLYEILRKMSPADTSIADRIMKDHERTTHEINVTHGGRCKNKEGGVIR